jgi:hypothetical protein
MQIEIIDLFEKHVSLLVGLAAGTLFAMFIQQIAIEIRRRRWRKRDRGRSNNWSRPGSNARGSWTRKTSQAPDAADQLRTVMGAEFSIQPLLNKSEARVFRELDQMVIGRNPGWQVMAQVSLGEILRCRDAEAYRCVNSKRVDLLLVDENCQPRHAVEYQGGAHHQGTAAARDAVKKEALRRAGIGYHEVVAGHTTPSELRRLVEKLVEGPNAA